jgi:hypothetical protein
LNTVQAEKVYGWYDRADQPIEQPTFNPDFHGPCLFCGNSLTDEDVRTHSIMPLGASRSYFYRTHRTCHEAAPDDQRNAIDCVVLDSIAHHGD